MLTLISRCSTGWWSSWSSSTRAASPWSITTSPTGSHTSSVRDGHPCHPCHVSRSSLSRVTTILVTEVAEYVFLCLFLTEMFVRIYALGPRIYFESSFNRWYLNSFNREIFVLKIYLFKNTGLTVRWSAQVYLKWYTQRSGESRKYMDAKIQISVHLQEVYLQRCKVFLNLKH